MKNHCFLCGKRISKKKQTSSKEHIFPAWLLEKYNYKRDSLTGEVAGILRLPNGNQVVYDDLKIPCCKTCNNEVLKNIEDKIKFGVDSGYTEFKAIPRITIAQWVAKIFWGLRIYDSLYVTGFDEESKQPTKLLQPDKLGYLIVQRALVEQLIGKSKVHDEGLSIFIFRTFVSEDYPFDYLEYEVGVAIRVGDIGIVCSFTDGGLTEETGFADYFADKTLTREQFAEVAYRLLYFSSCIVTPYYTMFSPEGAAYEEIAALRENCVEMVPKFYVIWNCVEGYDLNRFLEGPDWRGFRPNRGYIFDKSFGFRQLKDHDRNTWKITRNIDYKQLESSNGNELFAYLEKRNIKYHAFFVEEFYLTPVFVLLVFDDSDNHINTDNLSLLSVLNGVSIPKLRIQVSEIARFGIPIWAFNSSDSYLWWRDQYLRHFIMNLSLLNFIDGKPFTLLEKSNFTFESEEVK